MSGGHWDYANDHVATNVFGWCIQPNYGERGFSQSAMARKINPLEDKQLSELCWDMFCLLHSYDWYASGDISEKTYKADVKYFKKKWLKATESELVKAEVDKSISDLKQELYDMFITTEVE